MYLVSQRFIKAREAMSYVQGVLRSERLTKMECGLEVHKTREGHAKQCCLGKLSRVITSEDFRVKT